jgi:hypothetical protein
MTAWACPFRLGLEVCCAVCEKTTILCALCFHIMSILRHMLCSSDKFFFHSSFVEEYDPTIGVWECLPYNARVIDVTSL